MAIRKKLSHDMKTREKIRTSQLINRLENHVFGELDLSQSQVRGIEVLLRKTLPDLSAVHSTEGENKTLEDWLEDLDAEAATTQE